MAAGRTKPSLGVREPGRAADAVVCGEADQALSPALSWARNAEMAFSPNKPDRGTCCSCPRNRYPNALSSWSGAACSSIGTIVPSTQRNRLQFG